MASKIELSKAKMLKYEILLGYTDAFLSNPIKGFRYLVIYIDKFPENRAQISISSDALYRRTINNQDKYIGYLDTVKELLQYCKDQYDSHINNILFWEKQLGYDQHNGNSTRRHRKQLEDELNQINFEQELINL